MLTSAKPGLVKRGVAQNQIRSSECSIHGSSFDGKLLSTGRRAGRVQLSAVSVRGRGAFPNNKRDRQNSGMVQVLIFWGQDPRHQHFSRGFADHQAILLDRG